MLNSKKRPKKSLWFIRPTFFRPALTEAELAAHQEGERRRALQQQGNLYAWGRWLDMQREHVCRVPTYLRPSQMDAITPLPEAPTVEHQAVSDISRIKTQPLTDPHWRVIEPAIKLKMRKGA